MEGLLQTENISAIHDDLYVRTLFLTHETGEILIVSFDLLFFERANVDRFKGALGRRLGLRSDQIFLNTTHTHSGPRMTCWGYGGAPDPLYLDELEEALLRAGELARAGQRPVTLWAGAARTDLPVSRRKPDTDGRVQWFPNSDGTVCDALPFCLFKDEQGGVVSVLFSVACHPSMMYESQISAEYPGVAMRKLNEHFRTEGSLFLQGAAGDTKPRHVADEKIGWRHGTWEEMEAAGTEVANAVIDSAGGGLFPITPDLQTCMTEIQWPLNPVPTSEQLRTVRDDSDERQGRRLWAGEMLLRIERRGHLDPTVSIVVHFVQLGQGLRLIGVEGEVLAKLGLRMLEIYDKGITFALGYTNGTQIYLPVTEELPEGGYEVDSFWEYHHPSPLAVGGEDTLFDVLRRVRGSGLIPNEACAE